MDTACPPDVKIPIGLRYIAEDAQGVQAVFLPHGGEDGSKIVVVAEPGHDPAQQWHGLCEFMQEEEIPGSLPPEPTSDRVARVHDSRIIRPRHAKLPEGVRALGWVSPASVIVYSNDDLTSPQRGDAVHRALLALRVFRLDRPRRRPALVPDLPPEQ